MKHSNQLALALQVVSTGAAALRYAALATDVAPSVRLSPDFAYKALTAPLQRLVRLLPASQVEPISMPASPVRAPRAKRKAKPRRRARPAAVPPVTPKPGTLPTPADLGGFEQRINPWDPDELRGVEQLEASACRALLLEVVRRAAYDWVLYRSSSKLPNRQLAEAAYYWLFVEEQGTPAWTQRQRAGKDITGFVNICELLEIDPEKLRAKVRTMTERDIMGAGRPAERRRHKHNSDDVMQSDDHRVFDVDVDSLPTFDPMFAMASEG